MTAAPPAASEQKDSGAGLGTAPQPQDEIPARFGVREWSRWVWRQLTSMRTALMLLFLLALGTIPGSVLPQRGLDSLKVSQFLEANPALGGVFDTLGFFEVFSAPWFAAIYLLLCISLIGCVGPRARLHWKAMRSQPPPAPARLSRLAESRRRRTEPHEQPQALLDKAETVLARQRWRVRASAFDGATGWVAAEKGYLRETGNLAFHASLIVLLFGVAAGSMFGWRGKVIVVEGDSFANAPAQYGEFTPGPLVDLTDLPPFSFTVTSFESSFQEGGEQQGAPRFFATGLRYREHPADEPKEQTVGVNTPLVVSGAKVFLIGHGYAPIIQVKDSRGQLVYDSATVFLPTDANLTSSGVVKVPDVTPQLGLRGLFLPTAAVDPALGPISTFPAPNDPGLFLSAWSGDLGLGDGKPQSVYSLDVSKMTRTGIKALKPGDTWDLPEGAGTVTFSGFKEYATFNIARDPGKEAALAAAAAAIIGLMLSLFVRRRRVWVRVTDDPDTGQVVELAGLSRTEEEGLGAVLDDIADELRSNPAGPASSDRSTQWQST